MNVLAVTLALSTKTQFVSHVHTAYHVRHWLDHEEQFGVQGHFQSSNLDRPPVGFLRVQQGQGSLLLVDAATLCF